MPALPGPDRSGLRPGTGATAAAPSSRRAKARQSGHKRKRSGHGGGVAAAAGCDNGTHVGDPVVVDSDYLNDDGNTSPIESGGDNTEDANGGATALLAIPVCRHRGQVKNVRWFAKLCQDHGRREAVLPTACQDCGATDGLWLCATCGKAYCGRYVKKHALAHYGATHHSMTVNLSDANEVFCYQCDDYVPQVHLTPTLTRMSTVLVEILDPDTALRHDQATDPPAALPQAASLKRPYDIVNITSNGANPPVKKTAGNKKVMLKGVQGAVGLRNLGNTCFMNAVLQALGNTTFLREYFLRSYKPSPEFLRTSCMYSGNIAVRTRSAPPDESQNANCVADEFYNLVQEMWLQEVQAISPSSFLACVWRVVPSFRGYHQQDAQEFLRYILAAVHTQLVMVANRDSHMINVDAANENHMTLKDINSKPSAVTDIFGGVLWNQVECLNCHNMSYKEDPFLDLSLDIPEPGNKYITLIECLDFFTRLEHLEDSEKYLCSRCLVKQPCTKQFSIRQNPKALCLQFKRFRWGTYARSKLKNHVNFPLVGLDMTPYLDPTSTTTYKPAIYDLYAVVVHHGSGSGSGHYTACVFNEASGRWLEFNDGTVMAISTEDVLASQAYLLFYKLRS